MSAVRPRLSIDVGTLRTNAALDSGGGEAALVRLGAQGASTPSTVALADGQVIIGEAADAVMAAHPERGVRELWRRFGDTTPIVLDGQPFTADALTAELLRSVASTAGVQPGDSTVVLTHPAGWHEYKRELLAATGAAAGFAEVEVVSEAEAAVRPYVRAGRLQRGNTVAVYDLGGTFEVSLMAVTDAGLQSVGTPQTLERLGGDVLDQVVFRHVTEALGGTLQQLDRNDPAVRAAIVALRGECAAAKERLSSDGETAVPVVAPGLDTRVRMTRDEFETAVRPHVNETLMALDRVLASASLQATDLTAVVLVGGGSRVPVVAEMVAGHLGRPALVDDPGTAVALGAVTPVGSASTASALAVAATALSALPVEPLLTSSSTASDQRETPMSDQPAPENAAPAAGAPGAGAPAGGAGRSIPTPPPPPAKRVSAKAKGVAGGLAAAAAAITAAVFYGDDVVNAFDGPDGGADAGGIATAAGAETRTADRAEREAGGADAGDAADSMDAFDVATAADALTATAAPQGAAVGTPLSPPAPQQQSFDRPAPQHQHQQQQQHQQRASSDDDAPDLSPGRQAPGAAAAVGGVAAGAATAAGAAATGATATGPAVDSDFEASRAQLLARLDSFEAPEGTSPEDAAALKAELRDTIERFDPRPGQSTDDALADLRDEFDETVQDFTQDQRIDALIAETERDNAEDAADDTAAPDPVAPPADDADDDTMGDDTADDATDDAPPGDANNDGILDDAPPGDADNDGILDDARDADGDGTPDDPRDNDTGGPVGDPGTEPGTITIDPNLLEEPPRFNPELLDDGVAPQFRDGVELADDDSAGTGTGSDDGSGEAVGSPPLVDVQVTGEVLTGTPPLAGVQPTGNPPLDDGFEQLTATDAGDPGAAGEPSDGIVGDVAVPQVRATVMPGTDLPTMTMTDLGDETYQQVADGATDASIAPVVDAPVVAPEPLDLTIDATARPIDFEVPVVVPEPEPVELDIQPVNPPEDLDIDDGPGLAEDLHGDITPNAPDNLDFGG